VSHPDDRGTDVRAPQLAHIGTVGVTVVRHSPEWAARFRALADTLTDALAQVQILGIEHVGSTSVPHLPAKPVLDVDVIVRRADVTAAIAALEAVGYRHRGDLGVTDREAFIAPDDAPRRHVYVCVDGTLHLRNHLAVRSVLRARTDLRDRYGAVKLALAADPDITIEEYIAGKTAILQEVLDASDLTPDEKALIRRLNDPNG